MGRKLNKTRNRRTGYKNSRNSKRRVNTKRKVNHKRRVNTKRKVNSKRKVNTKRRVNYKKYKGGMQIMRKKFNKLMRRDDQSDGVEQPTMQHQTQQPMQPTMQHPTQQPMQRRGSWPMHKTAMHSYHPAVQQGLGEIMADDFKEYTTNSKFTQHFNILFGNTDISHLRRIKVCKGDYLELEHMLVKYKNDFPQHLGRESFLWDNIYLGNFINEQSKLGSPDLVDQVNAPFVPKKAIELINKIFFQGGSPADAAAADAAAAAEHSRLPKGNPPSPGVGFSIREGAVLPQTQLYPSRTPRRNSVGGAGNNPLHPDEGGQPHSQGICIYNDGQVADPAPSERLKKLVDVETVTLKINKTLLHGVKHRGETFYKGSYNPPKLVELIETLPRAQDSTPTDPKSCPLLIVTHGSFINNFLNELNSKLPGQVEVLKPGNFDCIKIYYHRTRGTISDIELYCSSTWGNKKILYKNPNPRPKDALTVCGVILMRHCPACHNTTWRPDVKRGLSGILSNCLPISIEFLLGSQTVEVNDDGDGAEASSHQLLEELDDGDGAEASSHQLFEELREKNLEAINAKESELTNKEELSDVEMQQIRKLRNYWNKATVEGHKHLLVRLAQTRLNNLYNVVFERNPQNFLPIVSCSFRTCLTLTMVTYALRRHEVYNP